MRPTRTTREPRSARATGRTTRGRRAPRRAGAIRPGRGSGPGTGSGTGSGSGLLYVYGFASPEAAACLGAAGDGGGAKGIEGLGPVRTLSHAPPTASRAAPEFVALVSAVPPGLGAAAAMDARAAMAHELVLSGCLDGGSVVPVRFGMIVTRRELLETMRRRPEQILALLRDTEGCVEVGLKAMWKEPALAEEIARIGRTDRRIVALRAQHERGGRPGEGYHRALRAGEIVAARLEEARTQLADRILKELEPLCVGLRRNPPSGERMVLNAAFLVRRARQGEFDQAVNRACGELTDSMDFIYTGPWPPYNFCSMDL